MRVLAVVVAAAVAFSSLPAASPEMAALRTSGVVVVNSVPMLDGATVRTGDVIRTGPDGLAIVTSPGHSRWEVRADSEARLRAGDIELLRGAVASSRLPVAAGGFAFRTAASAGAWYAVALRRGRLLVAAHRGAVLIAGPGQPPVVVPEGSYAEKESEPPVPPPTPARKSSAKRRKGAKAAAGSGASGGWTIGGLSHGASVALVVGVGAGVAAAAAGFALGLSEPGPSPND